MDNLRSSMHIAASGMSAQTKRAKINAENLANANSLSAEKNGEPYRRKTVSFKSELDRNTGANKVKVEKIGVDNSDFKKKFEPHHPNADKDGYVLYPNVDPIVETMDYKEAMRSIEANLGMLETSRNMLLQTLDILNK